MDIKSFFTKIQQESIQKAIEEAEFTTSGEIRVHIDSKCKDDVLTTATKIFEKLGMHKTDLRNGVLIYLAIEDKKFAILGDKGINELVADDFWNETRDIMLNEFKKGEFVTGLCQGIKMAGEKLKTHFPYSKHDKNELTNDISFEN